MADREFVGKEWIGWLNSVKLRYYIQVHKNFKVSKGNSNREVKVIHLICHLNFGEYACSGCRYNLKGNLVYIVGAHFRGSNWVSTIRSSFVLTDPKREPKLIRNAGRSRLCSKV